jgi:hypothetical protein
MNVLMGFASDVSERPAVKDKFGFDPTFLIVLMPMIVEMIAKCFDNAQKLQAFAEGERSALQLAGLRIRCNQAAREAGISGPLRVQRAGAALADGILGELDAGKDRMSGDLYAQAFEEARSVA